MYFFLKVHYIHITVLNIQSARENNTPVLWTFTVNF